MTTPVERFYAASHSRNADLSGGKSHADRDALRQEILGGTHRYSPVARYLRGNRDLSVVELGFGNPDLAAILSAFCSQYEIVDIVDRRNVEDMPANMHFTAADLNADFPFAENQFDCTVAMMVIEHLFDPFHSFSEVARITKKGGTVFVNLPNIASVKCRVQLLAGRMPVTSSTDWFEKREWDGNHLHFFTVADTIRVASLSGLRLAAMHPVGRYSWLKRLRSSLFCHEISYEFEKV